VQDLLREIVTLKGQLAPASSHPGSKAAVATGLPDVGLPPDSGGMADIPQPRLGADAVEKVPNCSTANFLPKDETRDDRSSICPRASCRSRWRVHRIMMLPPTQL
jgi:hypothetical protein